ncbi:hypothetical protein OC844_001073 [Tilletia horrida]|nr:hypothetical protein OC844_001073 [Tilletia horrida]
MYASRHRRTHTNEAASYPLSQRPDLSSTRSIAAILLWRTVQALINPRTTAVRIGRWFVRTLREIDDAFRDPRTRRRTWKPEWLDAYVPFLIWLGISLASTGTVIVFHTRVFTALDELSQTLQRLGLGGQFVMGGLIFLTTFPPMPLYSTLIVLCGFSFGMIEGFIIAYIAALSGAITVFLLSRTLLRGWMTGLLNKSGGLKKVVRAIEKQPKLLFLIRLAPYPYNLMNTLLASSPTLTFKTYTMCTALALPKLLVHTGLGTSIKNFAAYHGAEGGSGTTETSEEEMARSATAERVKRIAGLVGVLLCIGIFIYLMHVARKAVDNLDDEDGEQVGRDGLAGRKSRRKGKRRQPRSSASSSYSFTNADDATDAERRRLYTNADNDEDDDDLYSDDSGLYSGDDDGDDDDDDNTLRMHFGGSGPASGPASAGAVSEVARFKAGQGMARPSSAGPLSPHFGGGVISRFKAGLGMARPSSAASHGRYGPAPAPSEAPNRRSGAASTPPTVQTFIVSSVSTPLASVPVSLANRNHPSGRRAVVGGHGSNVFGGSGGGSKPRTSSVSDRSAFYSQMYTAAGRARTFPHPRLSLGSGSGSGPAAGSLTDPSTLTPIIGTPGAAGPPILMQEPQSVSPSSYASPRPLNPDSAPPIKGIGGAASDDEEDADGLGPMTMEDRIAEMENCAEEYFSTGRRWSSGMTALAGAGGGGGSGHSPSSATAAAAAAEAEALELQRLAQQQRRGISGAGGGGGPRTASEMGAEEARYGH